MKRIVLKYGAIASCIVAFMMTASVLVFHLANLGAESMFVGFLGMFIAFCFIFVAIKKYRETEGGGAISFGKGLQIGLLISLIASSAYVIAWALAYHFAFPDFMDTYSAMELEALRTSGLPAAKIAEKTKSIEWMRDHYDNPFVFTGTTLMEILPVGIGMSLLAALILMRKRRPGNEVSELGHA